MTKYYYDNRTKILKQNKLKYKQSKKNKNKNHGWKKCLSLSPDKIKKHLRIIL